MLAASDQLVDPMGMRMAAWNASTYQFMARRTASLPTNVRTYLLFPWSRRKPSGNRESGFEDVSLDGLGGICALNLGV